MLRFEEQRQQRLESVEMQSVCNQSTQGHLDLECQVRKSAQEAESAKQAKQAESAALARSAMEAKERSLKDVKDSGSPKEVENVKGVEGPKEAVSNSIKEEELAT